MVSKQEMARKLDEMKGRYERQIISSMENNKEISDMAERYQSEIVDFRLVADDVSSMFQEYDDLETKPRDIPETEEEYRAIVREKDALTSEFAVRLVELEEKYKKVQTVSSFLKIFSRCIRLMMINHSTEARLVRFQWEEARFHQLRYAEKLKDSKVKPMTEAMRAEFIALVKGLYPQVYDSISREVHTNSKESASARAHLIEQTDAEAFFSQDHHHHQHQHHHHHHHHEQQAARGKGKGGPTKTSSALTHRGSGRNAPRKRSDSLQPIELSDTRPLLGSSTPSKSK